MRKNGDGEEERRPRRKVHCPKRKGEKKRRKQMNEEDFPFGK